MIVEINNCLVIYNIYNYYSMFVKKGKLLEVSTVCWKCNIALYFLECIIRSTATQIITLIDYPAEKVHESVLDTVYLMECCILKKL